MKILFINTSEKTGGAAIACHRLMQALSKQDIEIKMLVRDKFSDNKNVIQVGNKLKNKFDFYWERGQIYLKNRFSRETLFLVSIANSGVSITQLPEFKEADIIHLHWINQGMLSVDEIGKIFASGKKVVWTMHDMWAFTGICHYARTCNQYELGCGSCPFLFSESKNDISHQVFFKKQKNYAKGDVTFVSVSNWLDSLAQKSPLLKGHNFKVIPNVIDIQEFYPQSEKDENLLRLINGRKVIIMGAVRLDQDIKGFSFLKLALQKLITNHQVKKEDLLLFLFGRVKYPEPFFADIPISYHYFNEISDTKKIAQLYNHSDVVVVPSLYETFGQTITEAMACGRPAVTFNNSGQTDIIDHKINGYLAEYKNSDDLANGIHWILKSTDYDQLCHNARNKVEQTYSEAIVAKKYIELYNNI